MPTRPAPCRTLFEVAREYGPSIIFLDEVDSLLSSRKADGENEASRCVPRCPAAVYCFCCPCSCSPDEPAEHDRPTSISASHVPRRRLKTEFLVQMDGLLGGADSQARVVLIGATNRPQELDDAARRRFSQRIYIPLPDPPARAALLSGLLRKSNGAKISPKELNQLVEATGGYSGSDLATLCREAAMEPLRDLGPSVATVPAHRQARGAALTALSWLHIGLIEVDPGLFCRVRPIMFKDLEVALQRVKPSVAQEQLAAYDSFTRDFGIQGS